MPVQPAEEAPKRDSVRFRAACRHCGKVSTRHSRKGLTWKCPECETVNPGPGLLEELTKTPAPRKRRREGKRESQAERRAAAAAADQSSGEAAPRGTPAPRRAAPVRRRSSKPSSAPNPTPAAAGGGQPEVGPAGAPPARRGFIDRLFYGGDD